MSETDQIPTIDLNGAWLNLAALQLILDTLNTHGACTVKNVATGMVNSVYLSAQLLGVALAQSKQKPNTPAES